MHKVNKRQNKVCENRGNSSAMSTTRELFIAPLTSSLNRVVVQIYQLNMYKHIWWSFIASIRLILYDRKFESEWIIFIFIVMNQKLSDGLAPKLCIFLVFIAICRNGFYCRYLHSFKGLWINFGKMR